MKKIGIVTMYNNYNYGSILQCYALQKAIEKMRVETVALNQKENVIKWKIIRLYRVVRFIISCIRFPQRIALQIKTMAESQRSCREIPNETRIKMDRFIENEIQTESISFSLLKKQDKDYAAFICGSDQIWSMAAPLLNPFMFARFTNREKRYSYAASLGADYCPAWHKRLLARWLKEFKVVSVRETESKQLLEKIGVLSVQNHCDPVLLLDAQEWMGKTQKIDKGKYAFLYFLNAPTNETIRHIEQICYRENVSKFVSAPYDFKIDLSNVEKMNLSPEEFLGAIANAEFVFTDSYHGMLFSMIFHTRFYVFEREYTHNMPQNSRFRTIYERMIIEKYNLNNSIIHFVKQFDSISSSILEMRNDATTYLRSIIDD